VASRPSTRQRLKRTAFWLAIAGGAWCAWLAAFGGVTIRALGITIRSNDITRPLALFVVAFAVWFALTDRAALFTRSRTTLTSPHAPLRLAWILSVVVIVIAVLYGSRVIGGADSYGYVSQADLLLSGRVTQELPVLPRVPWPRGAQAFIPLGYNPVPDRPIMAPKYPPGFPLILAAAKVTLGQCAMFAVVPVLAGALVLLTFLIGRELTSPWTALSAALFVAVSPAFLYQSVQPMSDVPAAAAFAAVCYAALRPGRTAAIGGGLAASIAMLVRPNLAPFVGAIGLWFVYDARPFTKIDRARWSRVAAFGLTGAIGPVAIAVVNHHVFGSSVHSGYGDISDYFEWSRVIENARLYSWWTTQSQTPFAFLSLITLFVPVAALWPVPRDRAVVLVFGLIVAGLWLEYCLYYTFGVWWFLRFLLPAWPLMMVGAAQALWWIGRRVPRVLVLAGGAAVCGYCLWFASNNFVFDLWRMQRGFYSVAQGVRRNVERRAVVYTNEESGSLRYYSGLVTFNYPDLLPADLDASVDFFAAHGAHPYLLVEDGEMDRLGASESKRIVDALGRQPVFVYYGGSAIRLFDLAPGGPQAKPTDVAQEALDGPMCPAPVTPRPLVLDPVAPIGHDGR
jgi:hypothetical protein